MGPDPRQYGRFGISGYGGVPPPPLPNVFGASAPGGPGQGALQAFLPLVSELVRQQTGYAGFTFGSDLNIGSTLYTRDYYQRLSQARAGGAAADRDQVDLLLRGLFVALGNRPEGTRDGLKYFDASGEAAIRELTGVIGGILPIAAGIAPDTVDAFLPRGSVAAAAGSFVNAGRFLAGPGGQLLNQTPDVAARVLQPLLAQGAGATAGLGAARLGQTFEALAAQGFIAGGEGVIEQSRGRIAEYSKVVAAINDVFGDAGRSNAPIPELIEGLQRLTGNAFGKLGADQISSGVRQLQAAAQLTPGGLAGLQAIGDITQDELRRSGASALLRTPITVGAAAAARVFADRGFGGRGPESLTSDEFVALAARQQAAGAGSEIGNLFGALVFQSQFTGTDTDLGRAAAALKAGQTSVRLGDGSALDLLAARPDQLADLARRSGLDPGAFLLQLGNRAQNQTSFALNPKLLEAVDRGQLADLRRSFFVAGTTLGLGDQDLGRIFEAALNVAGSGSAGGSAELANQTANLLTLQGLNLSTAQRGALGTIFGQSGLGLEQFQLLSPQTRQGIAAQQGLFGVRGGLLGLLTSLSRGGFSRNIATAIADLGRDGQDTSVLGTLLKGLGGVSEQQLGQTLSPLNKLLDTFAPETRKSVQDLARGVVPPNGVGAFGGAGAAAALGVAGAAAQLQPRGGAVPIIISIQGGVFLSPDGKQLRGEGSVN